METKRPQRAWVVFLRGSIAPCIMGIVIFIPLRFIYKRYSESYGEVLNKIVIVCIVFFATYWVFKIVVALFEWYARNVALWTKSDLDDKFIPLFRRITVTVIWALGLIILLGRFGVNINALVATLGVGSLAIALAAQDTIANIIAGFLIMLDRPFSVGDTIKLPTGEKVTVRNIGIRRSQFVGEDKAIIIMPNVELSKNKIVNYTYGEDVQR